jgi:hypothetical protein
MVIQQNSNTLQSDLQIQHISIKNVLFGSQKLKSLYMGNKKTKLEGSCFLISKLTIKLH